MPEFLLFIAVLSILAALGGASLMWGTDSRATIGDDHRR